MLYKFLIKFMAYLLEGNILISNTKSGKLRIKYLFFGFKRYKPLINGHKTKVKLYQAS
jgi:hypothetical protein